MTKALDRTWTIIQSCNLKTSFLTPLVEFISGGRYADQSSRFRIDRRHVAVHRGLGRWHRGLADCMTTLQIINHMAAKEAL